MNEKGGSDCEIDKDTETDILLLLLCGVPWPSGLDHRTCNPDLHSRARRLTTLASSFGRDVQVHVKPYMEVQCVV